MPSKRQQRKKNQQEIYQKKMDTQNDDNSNFDGNLNQIFSETETKGISDDGTLQTPSTMSKKRGRPKKLSIGQKTHSANSSKVDSSVSLTFGNTPRTSRIQSTVSVTASPLPKKDRVFDDFSSKGDYAQYVQIDFSMLNTLAFAIEKNPEATIWKRSGLSLFQFDDQHDKGLRLVEVAWNHLDNWMSGSFIFAYLCLLVKNSNRPTIVVDPILTDPSITRNKPSARSVHRSCFPDAESQPEVIMLPLHFSDHWALVVHDVDAGTYFVDSLARNPHRLHDQNEDNCTVRLELIQSVIWEFFPVMANQPIDFHAPSHPNISRQLDGYSCGYYTCLFAEAWLFNGGCLRLEPMDLDTEKRRILWHINELYKTDAVPFRPRVSQVDLAGDSSLSVSELIVSLDGSELSSVFSDSGSSMDSRRGGRPKKKKRGPGRPQNICSISSTPNETSSNIEQKHRTSTTVEQPISLLEAIHSNSIEIPQPGPWTADRIATHEVLDSANDIQHLWIHPTEWVTEDFIFVYQRYIASISYGRHVAVMIPQYSNPVVHSDTDVNPDNAVENCYNYSPEYDILVMTVFFPGHFALVIYDRSVRDLPQCLFIDPLAEEYDRMNDTSYPLFDARRLQLIKNTICALTPGLDERDLFIRTLSTADFTPQRDGVNCGFFVCLYPESYLMKGTFHIPDLDINFQRRRILWHLAQLIGSNDIPYIPLHTQQSSGKADLVTFTSPLQSVTTNRSKRSPMKPKQPIQANLGNTPRKPIRIVSDSDSSASIRRSPRLASLASSRESSVASVRNHSIKDEVLKSQITQRCHMKHKGIPCADVRAEHTTTYYDSGNLGDKKCDLCKGLLFKSEAKKVNGVTSSWSCCKFGQVQLPKIHDPPEYLKDLSTTNTAEAKEFRKNQNIYNTLLSFASVSVGHQENTSHGGVCFLLNGEFVRCMSSIVSGQQVPSFSQLFILDAAESLEFRKQNKYGGDRVDENTLRKLDQMIRECHPLAEELQNFHAIYKNTLESNGPDAVKNFRLTLLDERQAPTNIQDPSLHQRQVNLPTERNLFAVHTEADIPPRLQGIWITTKEGKLDQFPPYHPLTDSLCYTLLLPNGDDGYHKKLPKKASIMKKTKKADPFDGHASECESMDDVSDCQTEISEISEMDGSLDDVSEDNNETINEEKMLSLRDYVRYRMTIREDDGDYHPIWSAGGALSQKLILDYSARIDADVAEFLRKPELNLRTTLPGSALSWLSRNAGLNGPEELGSVVMFRKSHPGTRPFFQEYFNKTTTIMARVKRPACATFMLTFTCNPNWPEIRRNHLRKDQKTVDRFDILSRVFEDKLKLLHHLLDKKDILGKQLGYGESREFQKRIGGPHIHRVFHSDILAIPENIENLIWAHIPPKPDDSDQSEWANFIRKVRELVGKYQLHDCGPHCKNKKGKCRYGYPKPYSQRTILFDDKPAILFRPSPEDGGATLTVKKGSAHLTYDNRRVVAYNPLLLVLFETHHCLEPAYGKSTNLKYLMKYPFKGPSFSYIRSSEDGLTNVDEPKQYAKMLYRSPVEAYSRIMSYSYAFLSHVVIPLSIHLPGKQKILIPPGKRDEILEQVQAGNLPETALTAYWKQWRSAYETGAEMATILFEHMPETHSFNTELKEWLPIKFSKDSKRAAKRKPRIGRIYPVSPHAGEKFALYLLMKHYPGDPDHLMDVNGQKCASFIETARLRGLIEDSDVWIQTLEEGATSLTPAQMRQLLVGVLIFGSTESCIIDGKMLWERFLPHFYDSRCTDAERPGRIDRALALIERLLLSHGKTCEDFGLPVPSVSIHHDPNQAINNFFFPGAHINDDETDATVDTSHFEKATLNGDQQKFYDDVFKAVVPPADGQIESRLFFLSGDGGTGKTFLLNYILYNLRRMGIKVTPTASTGIAATRFYSGGTTLHSAFRLGIELERGKLPQIAFDSYFGRKIVEAQVIIIDEITMLNRLVLEIVDELCRLMPLRPEYKDLPFGGRVVIKSGDWKQSLPVVDDYGLEATVEACVQNSPLYDLFKKYRLMENMRVKKGQGAFVKWLDDIGTGATGAYATIPKWMIVHTREELVQSTFNQGFSISAETLLTQLMLATTNRVVDLNNDIALSTFKDNFTDYYSADKPLNENPLAVNAAAFDVSALNELQPSGFPPHHLRLKVGSIVVLLLNLNTSRSLCNGTRLIVRELTPNLLKCEALTGGSAGGIVIGISRATFTHKSRKSKAVSFERQQFPVRVAFTMTIQKAQGQTAENVGVDFTEESFAHGQTYTAFSRATNWDNIRVYAPNKKTDKDGNVMVANIVSKDIKLD